MSTLEAAIQRVNSAVADSRTTIGRFREQQLAALHQSLLESETAILDSLFNDYGRHRVESRIELLVVLKHIKALFTTSTFSTLKAAQSKAAGEGSFKKPVGSAAIVASENAPIESWAGPLASAITAGCPAVVLVPDSLKALQATIESVFSKLDRTAYRVVFSADTKKLDSLETDILVISSKDESARKVHSQQRVLLFPTALGRATQVNGNMVYVSHTTPHKEIAQIAKLVVRGAFAGNGANLNGVDYALVHEEVHAEFVDAAIAAAKEMYGADESFSKGKQLASRSKETAAAVADAVKSGSAQIVFGGSKQGDALSYTILDNVTDDSPLIKNGSSSPVLPVVAVTSTEHVIAIQTDSPSSTCFIFANHAECEYFARELTASTIFANDIPVEAITGIASTTLPVRISPSLFQRETLVVQRGISKIPSIFAPFPPSAVHAVTKVWPGRAALTINRKAHPNSFLRAFFPQGLVLAGLPALLGMLSVLGYSGYVVVSKLLQYRSSFL